MLVVLFLSLYCGVNIWFLRSMFAVDNADITDISVES